MLLVALIMINIVGTRGMCFALCNPIMWPTLHIILYGNSMQRLLCLNLQPLTIFSLDLHSYLWARYQLKVVENEKPKEHKLIFQVQESRAKTSENGIEEQIELCMITSTNRLRIRR